MKYMLHFNKIYNSTRGRTFSDANPIICASATAPTSGIWRVENFRLGEKSQCVEILLQEQFVISYELQTRRDFA
jgi:hypothetical protein